MLKTARWAAPLALILLGITAALPPEVRAQAASSKIQLTTTSFTPGGLIPKRFTCEAADVLAGAGLECPALRHPEFRHYRG